MGLKTALFLILLFRPVTHPRIAVRVIEMEVTAYCGCEKCCGIHADGITASGHKLCQGDKIIAAPKIFRFGTRIHVPGYGLALVEDRGGAIQGNRLDVYFHTHQEALEWGRRIVQVQIFGE